MPLLKRKPVLMHPLPPLAAIVQPVHPQGPKDAASASGEPSPGTTAASVLPPDAPQDGEDEDQQYDKLVAALNDPTLLAPAPKRGQRPSMNGGANGTMPPPSAPAPAFRVKNVDVFYIPETGEIFLDYESYASRRAFYDQPLFQCEVSGKSSLTYFKALQNEAKEVRQLHARFPRQLKKAVLESVQFQVEGKLETLADKVYERFVNRFFDDEKVFVDVQGDKYLARIVKTFPPRSLNAPAGKPYHPFATDLGLTNEEVADSDDPMGYFYNVRLIEEGGDADSDAPSTDGNDEGKGEMWQSSVMEVQADKISRDRINYSRAMLKRFIRDCVSRDAAIYSPWLVKKSVAHHYGLPTEMTDEIRAAIDLNRTRQMERRKRDRDERLGITHSEAEEEAPPPKKKKQSKAEREKEEKDKKEKEEEEKKKKRGIKYPIEDMLLEYAPERDAPAGRIEVRPAPNKELPFGDHFEKFLMAWSFLNVMGEGLDLSPFTIDEFEQALYHNDHYTGPVPLLVEIHAALLNTLVRDLKAGHEAVKPLAHCGQVAENDTDYWEGTKGATTETLRPIAEPAAEAWSKKELTSSDRKGWEMSLVGCLWERATLDVLPQYLDNILHLTFEDKPAPTRPTWSTGPASASTASGLIHAKPEKRYTTLHFLCKLNIINFLIELVAQTSIIRDHMEESTAALTEVRKEQIEEKREWRRVRAELEALEPKGEKGQAEGEGDGDGVKEELGSPDHKSPNGHANGEHDELDDSVMGDEDTPSRATSPLSDSGRVKTAASRRRAMAEKAAEREAEEALRAKEREEVRAKRAETKHAASEKKRLQDEEVAQEKKLHKLEQDFRRYLYTLRGRPLGTDRFGNKVWWLDGLGSAPLYVEDKLQWGSGRLYLQGVEDLELEMLRLPGNIPLDHINDRREKEEGGRLAPGEWATYDTPEQLLEFYNWLNPRGYRELHLQRALKLWWKEIEGGMRRRRIAAGLDALPEAEEPTRRQRLTRRAAGGEESVEGYMGWRNRR